VRALGIDPSQRHTGLAFLEPGGQPVLHHFNYPEISVLEAGVKLKQDLVSVLHAYTPFDVICVEKQLSVGGQMSSLMFYMQMMVLEALSKVAASAPGMKMVMPLPVQLKSYMKHHLEFDIAKKSTIVASYKKKYQYSKRISSHEVDAHCLAMFGISVLLGTWGYKKPSRESLVHPFEMSYGQTT